MVVIYYIDNMGVSVGEKVSNGVLIMKSVLTIMRSTLILLAYLVGRNYVSPRSLSDENNKYGLPNDAYNNTTPPPVIVVPTQIPLEISPVQAPTEVPGASLNSPSPTPKQSPPPASPSPSPVPSSATRAVCSTIGMAAVGAAALTGLLAA